MHMAVYTTLNVDARATLTVHHFIPEAPQFRALRPPSKTHLEKNRQSHGVKIHSDNHAQLMTCFQRNY